MKFRIVGLDVAPFLPLFNLTDAELLERGARREIASDSGGGYPCRVTLEEPVPGERLLLVNHEHQSAHSPFRSRHAIYVREVARQTFQKVDVVPELMRSRLLSVRAFDEAGMMVDADVIEGSQLESLIDRQLADQRAAYLHIHFARPGCYAARVERA